MGKEISAADIEPISDEDIVKIEEHAVIYLLENDIDCQAEVELSKAIIGLIKRLDLVTEIAYASWGGTNG